MSIMNKLKKNSKVEFTDVLSNSKFFNEKDMVPTDVPMMNVALSGSVDGGLAPGLTVLAGPSKHFKTSFALIMASAYLKKYEDAALLFYDSEFGSPQEYFQNFGIDTDRVLHTPITNVEELKFDLINQLENLDRDDKVVVVIDSVGKRFVPHVYTLSKYEEHSNDCCQSYLQRDWIISKRCCIWWYRYLLFC